MAVSSYTPGTWFGILRSGTVVLLGPETPQGLVRSLWRLLESSPEVHEVLHEVTAGFGVSLSRIPPFGIIDTRDPLRVFLRGGLEMTVSGGLPAEGGAASAEAISGRDITTWTERRISGAGSFALEITDAARTPGLPGNYALPISDGVVRLSGFTFGRDVQPDVGLAAQTTPLREAEVSVETVMGFNDDLELTIAPGQLEPAPELTPEASPEPVGNPVALEAAASPEEFTSSYDHLWDKTVVRNIEDAAVRVDPDAEPAEAPQDEGQQASKPAEAADGAVAAAVEVEAPRTEQTPQTEQTPGQGTSPSPTGLIETSSGLIDSVPWSTKLATSRTSPVDAGPQAPAQEPAPMMATPKAVPPEPNAPQRPSGNPAVPDPSAGDHDGETVMKSSIAGLGSVAEGEDRASGVEPGNGAAGNGPRVLARVCGHGHPNPPTYALCANCGMPLPGDAIQVPRPSLGRVRISTGEVIDLDQSLIIGRQPSVTRVQGGAMPRLVQVASPGGDISRSHVEVRLEGWHVMLCDLKATNGTVLVREGQAPRRLAQSEMAILLDGDIAELGDDISLRFEEIL